MKVQLDLDSDFVDWIDNQIVEKGLDEGESKGSKMKMRGEIVESLRSEIEAKRLAEIRRVEELNKVLAVESGKKRDAELRADKYKGMAQQAMDLMLAMYKDQ